MLVVDAQSGFAGLDDDDLAGVGLVMTAERSGVGRRNVGTTPLQDRAWPTLPLLGLPYNSRQWPRNELNVCAAVTMAVGVDHASHV
jgi:hypothetical protein